jgi:hypothetical protein
MQITGLHPALNYAIQSLGELCFKLNKSNAAQIFLIFWLHARFWVRESWGTAIIRIRYQT